MKYPDSIKPTDAERGILAELIWEEDTRGEILDTIDIFYFSVKTTRRIFDVISTMYNHGKPVDLATFCDEYRAKYPADYNASQLVEMVGEKPVYGLWKQYLHSIKIHYDRRRVFQFGDSIMNYAVKVSHDELYERVASEAIELAGASVTGDGTEERDLSRLLDKFVNNTEERNREGLFCTGIRPIDEVIEGFRRKQYFVIAGRPSQGKTSLAFNLSLHLARHGVANGIISLETDTLSVQTYLLSIFSGIPFNCIKRMDLDCTQEAKLDAAITKMKDFRISICDKFGMTVQGIRNEIRRMKVEHPDTAVVMIDYLQLILGAKGQSRNNELGEISRAIKQIGKEFDVAMVILSQLNRNIEYEGRTIPQMSDMRESGDIEQDADIMLAFHFKDISQNTRRLRVLKQKEGPSGVDFDLSFRQSCLRFS